MNKFGFKAGIAVFFAELGYKFALFIGSALIGTALIAGGVALWYLSTLL